MLRYKTILKTNHNLNKSMKLPVIFLATTLVAITSCATKQDSPPEPPLSTPPVTRKYPPVKAPTPKSPVDLNTAVLTLPADALSEISQQGRWNYVTRPSGLYDKINRRIELVSDNSLDGIDAKSMLFLRLFEDESGRTIAASHAARPFADRSAPSSRFTKIYRLENHKWRDITNSALSNRIPKDSYFKFDRKGSKVEFGPYILKPRRDGKGNNYGFSEKTQTMIWKNGSFRVSQ